MTRLIIRRLGQADLGERTDWINNPTIYRAMPFDVPVSLSSTEQWYQRVAAARDRVDLCFDVIEEDGRCSIGAMGGLVAIEHRHKRAELYIMVNPSRLRQGIGRASVRWLCAYGFQFLGLRRIYLYTLGSNNPAQKLYEGLGFAREGWLRQHHCHMGVYVDRCIYGLLREDWNDPLRDVTFCLNLDS